MSRNHWFLWCFVAAIALAWPPSGPAQAAGQDRDVDPAAVKSIERLSEFIGRTKQFSVTVDVAYDIVQEWGQKIEFGETRLVTMRRPDRLRVATTDRDGSVSGVVFDGQTIAAFDLGDKVYATTPQTGTVDEAIDHFINDLGMKLPMAPILQGRLATQAKDWARDIRYVGESTIGGVACDHVALHGDWEDVQLWIARGDRPLLQRIVITYHRAEGKPQFTGELRDWNLNPDVADAAFAYTPQEGAAHIAFKPRETIAESVDRSGGARP